VLFASLCLAADQRFIRNGSVGTGHNKICYILSAQYQTLPGGATGNIFAAAQGINLPVSNLLFPWTALGYIKGAVDLDGYSTTALGAVTASASASGALAAWSYAAIGEFCDVNGKEGFQNNTSDYIIGYYFPSQALVWENDCGVGPDPVTGDTSYYSTVKTSLGDYFSVTCRVFATDTTTERNGRTVGPYSFKCDVTIDYQTLWSNNTAAINGCSDDNRKIGMLVNVAGTTFDVDVKGNLNLAGSNSPDGDKIEFNAGKLAFSWDNYYVKPSSFTGTTGGTGVVTADYVKTVSGDANAQLLSASTIQQIIFSFDAPKSANNQFYYWDPSTTLLDTGASSHITATLGLLFMCIVVLFF